MFKILSRIRDTPRGSWTLTLTWVHYNKLKCVTPVAQWLCVHCSFAKRSECRGENRGSFIWYIKTLRVRVTMYVAQYEKKNCATSATLCDVSKWLKDYRRTSRKEIKVLYLPAIRQERVFWILRLWCFNFSVSHSGLFNAKLRVNLCHCARRGVNHKWT